MANRGKPTQAKRRRRRRPPGRRLGDVHIAIDDCTRLAYAEVLRDNKAPTVVASSGEWPSSSAGTESQSSGYWPTTARHIHTAIHAIACRALGIRHHRPGSTDPKPRQSGTIHPHPHCRLGLRRRLPQLNRTGRRPRRLAVVLQPSAKHAALGHKPPITRLSERINLLGTYHRQAPDHRDGAGVRAATVMAWAGRSRRCCQRGSDASPRAGQDSPRARGEHEAGVLSRRLCSQSGRVAKLHERAPDCSCPGRGSSASRGFMGRRGGLLRRHVRS